MQLHFLAKKLIMKEHVKKNSFSVHVFNDSKLFLWVCCKTTDKVRRFFNEIKHCANNFYRTSNIWFCYSIFAYKIYCKYETKCLFVLRFYFSIDRKRCLYIKVWHLTSIIFKRSKVLIENISRPSPFITFVSRSFYASIEIVWNLDRLPKVFD